MWQDQVALWLPEQRALGCDEVFGLPGAGKSPTARSPPGSRRGASMGIRVREGQPVPIERALKAERSQDGAKRGFHRAKRRQDAGASVPRDGTGLPRAWVRWLRAEGLGQASWVSGLPGEGASGVDLGDGESRNARVTAESGTAVRRRPLKAERSRDCRGRGSPTSHSRSSDGRAASRCVAAQVEYRACRERRGSPRARGKAGALQRSAGARARAGDCSGHGVTGLRAPGWAGVSAAVTMRAWLPHPLPSPACPMPLADSAGSGDGTFPKRSPPPSTS